MRQGGCTCRRDGHNWRKKADGKTIRETHEKLKVRRTLSKCHSCMSMLDCFATLVLDVFAADSITPSKPQVGNKEALNCYYAHADQEDQLQVLLLACLCFGPSVHLESFAWRTARRTPHLSRLSCLSNKHIHQLQRRCYWMLEGDDSIVLVHYLAGNAAARHAAAQHGGVQQQGH
jgi:CG-1 domain